MRSIIIAVDFDGCLCDHEFPRIGEPRTWLIKLLTRLRKDGHRLILWTCRQDLEGPGQDYCVQAVEWCRGHGLEFDAINDNLPEVMAANGNWNSRKIFCDFYLDDRNLIIDDKFGMVIKGNLDDPRNPDVIDSIEEILAGCDYLSDFISKGDHHVEDSVVD